jgi:hypothetical protein
MKIKRERKGKEKEKERNKKNNKKKENKLTYLSQRLGSCMSTFRAPFRSH